MNAELLKLCIGIEKAKKHFSFYRNQIASIKECYRYAMQQKEVKFRPNLLLGQDHEEIRFKLDEIDRDCLVGVWMIELVEKNINDHPKKAARHFENFKRFFKTHAKKTAQLDSKLNKLFDRFASLHKAGYFSSSSDDPP